jgi:hypothetical protein
LAMLHGLVHPGASLLEGLCHVYISIQKIYK